ncbi:hypothetical protein TSOC_004201 [Tetrabaena socialis]|uniref:Pherophorin domain-containing protein n=1 Tax=Tetrabaena socialis TaxID=47790 RepID=A0A2J8A9I4_9CHLO|nr:hypothetical protein TSOC_004201 [Tetrabaena socialis]|eukprot:PNH09179.1 hypothetical protein TSOC_004201 [Tetrabaena socialis]
MALACLRSLLLLTACLSVALASRALDSPVVRRSLAAGTMTPSNFCGLRDFPPIPDGYGASRLYCIFNKYDHFFMWRVLKVGSGALASGDTVNLIVHQPMQKYCKLQSQVVCGVPSTEATAFTIEKQTGTGVIDPTTDAVVLKVGSQYCSLTGSKHSQQLRCSAAKAAATAFVLPASSFVHVSLVNSLTKQPCGFKFYSDNNDVTYVTCNDRRFSGYATNLTVALNTPGAPVVAAGAQIAFKVYDDLYTYQTSGLKVDAQKRVWADENNVKGASQWFTLERTSGAATGGALTDLTAVALKSVSSGMFCGVTEAFGATLTCDKAGPAASLPAGYKFTYDIMA